jgi:hypothetical protein
MRNDVSATEPLTAFERQTAREAKELADQYAEQAAALMAATGMLNAITGVVAPLLKGEPPMLLVDAVDLALRRKQGEIDVLRTALAQLASVACRGAVTGTPSMGEPSVSYLTETAIHAIESERARDETELREANAEIERLTRELRASETANPQIAEACDGFRRERDGLRALLEWLNRRGGLGLDVHAKIDAALATGERLCAIPANGGAIGYAPCEWQWGHEGDMHSNGGDGFYNRAHDEEHHRRQAAKRQAKNGGKR